ncbi:PTS sugar transporter subunit IIA [Tetragenococcus halophilus]|uniref:PTS sugar transporter subunit IIA n=1 Tax=Tetragenococcus halophilus TaxID=51669 RepID=UPI000B929972|nr:PTS sugar transporter subunit IIA [Tetragenococcus halophilus]MCT8311245.1 PTS sugar transporter subunit IIA [Tetragenococcus halophilus]
MINKEIISQDYQKLLLREYSEMPEFISLRRKIVLPHLAPNLINQKLGVSLLIAKKGFSYNGYTIKVAFLLATPDKTSHLAALYDVNKTVNDENFIDGLIMNNSKKSVIHEIGTFIYKEVI